MFRQMERTQGARERSVLLRRIADALTGHAIAEEVALYPMIEILGMKRPSEELYDQQQDAKGLLARLDNGPKAGPAFLREFQTLASAVRAHVAEEEQEVYPMLRQRATRDQNMKMSMDFEREFRRYADSV